jgi:hypothetical protein
MTTIPELIPLHDNRPGLRALVQVEIREAAASPASEGEAGGSGLPFSKTCQVRASSSHI